MIRFTFGLTVEFLRKVLYKLDSVIKSKVDQILTVKFSFLLYFESIFYTTFCTFKFDGFLPSTAAFIINEFNRTEI